MPPDVGSCVVIEHGHPVHAADTLTQQFHQGAYCPHELLPRSLSARPSRHQL
jgi:hypothetical protein